ncbi:hypothetical protein Adeg_0734 [Ammonifex degensii KC4]|uniref:Uncharacterized protein n=1 Tax=Ammonifex degensii (strain DSM 10501 / KC4) TaxID=429009 RepID=C9RCA3_AMMDK|nr:hypothetical protein [Ammonifex degensii]ACX51880.1 hypothetical protein Adeg_0734 [Ammonifex degensii KC4]
MGLFLKLVFAVKLLAGFCVLATVANCLAYLVARHFWFDGGTLERRLDGATVCSIGATGLFFGLTLLFVLCR